MVVAGLVLAVSAIRSVLGTTLKLAEIPEEKGTGRKKMGGGTSRAGCRSRRVRQP
jgi:hypothetical protein